MNYDVLLRLSFLYRALDGNKKEMNFVDISLVKGSTQRFSHSFDERTNITCLFPNVTNKQRALVIPAKQIVTFVMTFKLMIFQKIKSTN